MSEQIITKKCSTCKEIKPLSEFNILVSANDGRHNRCKLCHNVCNRKYKRSNKGKIAARRYINTHTTQCKARRKILIAVICGKLPHINSLQCSCGNQAEHYHHPSYAPEHWFDIIPVCIPCHRHLSLSRRTA